MIYFCTECEVDGSPVKIGLTRGSLADGDWRHGVASRVSALQIGNPRILVVPAVMDGGSETERDLHKRFATTWITGEWFARTAELDALLSEHRVAPVYSLLFGGPDVPFPALPVPPALPESRLEGLLTAEDIEDELKVPRGFMRRLRIGRNGPVYVRAGKGYVFYRRADVDAWFASCRVVPEKSQGFGYGTRPAVNEQEKQA